MKRFLIALLLALNAALGLGLAWLWLDTDGQLRDVSWHAPAPHKVDFLAMVPDLAAPASADVSQFLSILERPIFALTRRPLPPPAPPPPPPPPDPLADLQIYGLVTGDKLGGILAKVEGKTKILRLNQAIGVWTLKTISDREVVFANGTQSRTFALRSARLTGPVPVSEAAPAVAGGMPAAPAPAAAAAPAVPSGPPQWAIGGSAPPARKP